MDARTPHAQTHVWHDLSAAQRGVWLDLQLMEAPLGYQLGGWARVEDALDVDVARQSVSLVMARHDALRLRIDPEQPRQRVEPTASAPVSIGDLSHLSDPEAGFLAFADQAFARGLPLGDAPLFQVDLVRCGSRLWYALWRCHHLIADQSSVALMLRLWTEAYEALSGEAAAELSPPSSFVGLLAADSAFEASAQGVANLGYWRSRFADRPEPMLALQASSGAVSPELCQPELWQLEGAAYQAFVASSRSCGVTTQRALLAAMALMLGAYYGRRDIAIGVALHRRDFLTRGLVGMLAGLLPVRCAIDAGEALADNVAAIGAALDRDFRHQRIAIDALSRALGGLSDGRGGLVQVVVSHLTEEAPPVRLALSGRALESAMFRGPEMMPLALYLIERPYAGTLDLELAGNPAFIDQEQLRQLASALRLAIAGVVEQPDLLAGDLPSMSEAERCRVLALGAGEALPVPALSLPALFAAEVARAPAIEAVIEAGRSLSYAALDAASDALAARLQAQGVGLQDVVGVALARSLDTVVALLAVLKAGAVYLPLDPAYPPSRLAFMLADAGASLAITDTAATPCLPDDMPRLLLDAPPVAPQPLHPVALRPDLLAYIVYTSGSTGAPKGVGVSHASAASVALARCAGHDPIGPGDRVLAAISVGFDVSIGQLLLPLLSGACVVVAPDLRTLSGEAFWALLAEHRVSHVNSVPSFFDSVLDAAPARTTLTRLMLGGEALTGALCRRLRAALPGVALVNMYGPTEACIDATAYPVPETIADGVLPIGRPLANTRAYVLDERLRPVPPGVAGALYLGGAGLARGYIGKPGLTAARFVADPFVQAGGEAGGEAGGRLYRTGDRARWLADGTLAFLGRDDGQVKIRGFRVEPGEIEAALCRHPGVAQAAVAAHPDSQGGLRLVAYTVAAGTPADAADLRLHVSTLLPAHMVPAAFVALAALPLTRNGKLDRAALPAPAMLEEVAYTAPATPLERSLATLFEALLDVAQVGASDNFFALGGHSLLATRLVSRVRTELGVDLPLRAVFTSPTVAGLAAFIDGQAAAPATLPLTAGVRPDDLPLSFAQERLWVLEQLDPGKHAYVIPAALRLTGTLDADALDAALRRVIGRHESLRSRIESRGGRAVQVVGPTPTTPVLERHDLSLLGAAAQAASLAAQVAAAEREPFVLAEGDLVRARLLRLAPETHVLVLAIHHIVADGWSVGVLLQELTTLYAAFARGLPDPLPPLAVQYADYALWQRRWLTEAALAELATQWRTALAGAPHQLDLPVDRPRPAAPSLRGAALPWRCDPALAERLRGVARATDATPFMLLLTAFQAVLSRWSGLRDLIVGTPVAQRDRSEIEPMIGFFVNTLPLRATFPADRTFAEALAAGRETILAAYASQSLPFELLVQALQPERDRARAPIVQVMFVLQNAPMPAVALPGLRLEPLDVPVSVAKFDLTLSLAETDDGGLAGAFEYATDLFDAATIERLGAWFSRLLAAVAENPAIAVDAIALMDEDARRLVLSGWNPPALAAPSDPLPALFAAQVSRAPAIEAVIEAGRLLSYAALDAASDALAARLQAQGVGLQDVVGVALARSLDTVVALLAVLKAGAVYLPLDPAYPPSRLAFMLADAGASLAITDTAATPCLPDDMPRLLLDAPPVAPQPLHPVALRPDLLAYIVYTSGSTGAPKGVGVSHASAASVALARCAGHDPIGPGDRVLAAISVGFDVSIGQLLLPLLSGACVVVAPDLRTLSGEAFWALLAEHRVSHVNSVPSFFDSVLDAAPARTTLTRLMLGGEALTGALCRRLRAALPGVALVNMYGPTEACIDATAYPVPETIADGVLPIGRPLANTRAYVLDERLRPVPPGVAGALYLGGAGLARGYIGKPGLTAARFVADPFVQAGGEAGGEAGGRLYRTGDRARWLADGTLAFLGRDDGQVKIRGFRVEPGEIEAALCRHPGVAQAAVAAHPDSQGGLRLVAYTVAAGTPADAADLRLHVSTLLPAHMVPAAFVALAALPLTRNGKLDRAALPAPAAGIVASGEPGAGDREALLCALFAELTGAASVGRDDGFFALGGDSISAIRLVSLARSRGKLMIQVVDIFAHPTPAALALVARLADDKASPQVPASGAVPPTPLQQALLAAGAPIRRFYQAVALHPPAGLDPDRIAEALNRLVREHAALRLTLDGDALSIPDAPPDAPPMVLHRLVYDDPAELEAPLRALSDGFDLSRGAAVTALLATARDGDRPDTLFLAIHHFAVDGVSWRILLDDLGILCAGEPATLGAHSLPSSLPLRAWTAYLHAQATPRRSELALWQEMLAPAATLPLDHGSTAANTIGASRSLSRALSEPASARLLAAPAVYRAEINDLLLAAFGLALAQWNRAQRAVHVVAVEGHGREPGAGGLDITRTVGWFTTLYPVRLDMAGLDLADALAGGAAAGEAIRRVKATLRRLPDHGLGFGILRHLDPESSAVLASLPAPSVLFNYLGRFAHAAETDPRRWRAAALPVQPADDAERSRDPVLLEANALLDGGGALHVNWTYAPGHFDEATIAALADLYGAALEAVARHCIDAPLPAPERLIPADFSHAHAHGLDGTLLAALAAAAPDLESIVPLTPLQQGLAFETAVRGAGAEDPYHVQGVLRLAGAIEPERLRAAWLQLMQRHDVLRLTLPERALAAGLGVLRPAAALLDWQVLDWRFRAAAEAERDLAGLMADDRATPFDLARGPLLRVVLARRGDDANWLMVSNHHALLDGWSMPVLIGELQLLYDGAALPPTPPWTAFIDWLQARDRAQAAAFWAARYIGVQPDDGALMLPPPDCSGVGAAELAVQLPAVATASLESFARVQGLTMATVVLGAWALLLRPLRAAPANDLVLGVTSGGRPAALAGSDRAVGLFIQTLPLRLAMAAELEIVPWLHALQTALIEQEAQGWLGLPAIRRAAGLPGDRMPFEALFVFENYPRGAGTAAPTSIRVVGVTSHDVTHYPVGLAALPGDAGLRLRLTYDRRRLGAADAAAMLQRLQDLLAHLAEQADGATTLDDLPSMSEAERCRVLALGAGEALPVPALSLPALFAAQVSRAPAIEAVIEAGRSLSYAALDAASDALAARLQAQGVGLQDVVGVALARSLDTVVALLAVLKAGAVYLPLDPAYPPSRLAFMLADAGASLAITDTAAAPCLPHDMPRLLLDAPPVAPQPLHPVALRPELLAYIVYTSGSTGAPKGVGVSHASAASVALARCAGHDPIGPGDRVLAAISVGFDVSIGQLLLPLLSGACVVVAPDLRTLSGEAFWALLAEHRVSHVNSVPSFFDSVLDAAPARTTLTRLMLGGEALTGALCRRLRAALPGVALVNMYGPTEACIDATAYPVPETIADGVLPIGRPLANTRAYVLDERLRPVPPGVAGALYLGGAGLARGYVGKPGLTATRFVADPFVQAGGQAGGPAGGQAGGEAGGRLYRTGDRARWLADGTLAFLGRDDGQVKIRGFRVEPGEIEAALCRHPGVAQAAVAAHPDSQGGLRLVAYTVAAGAPADAADLRLHVSTLLPAHMVPAAFVALAALPLTRNGKLDRAALPAPAAGIVAPSRGPRDATEFRLQAIWQQVLGLPQVGLHDDFFELGGDSLLGFRLIGACSVAFGIALPMTTLFSHRTIERMAAVLRDGAGAPDGRLVVLRPGEAGVAPLVCVHPQGGTVFCYGPLVAALPPGLPVLGLQAAGFEPDEELPDSVPAMAANYLDALRARQPDGPYRLLGYSLGGTIAFEMAVQLRAAGQDVSLLTLLDSWRPDGSPPPSQTRAELFAMLGADIGLPEGGPPIGSTAELYAAAIAAGVVPAGFTMAHAERIVAVWMNNAELVERYVPPAGLDAPLLQLRAMRRDGPPSDWSPLITAAHPTHTHDIDCDHREMVAAGSAAAIAIVLNAGLEQETR